MGTVYTTTYKQATHAQTFPLLKLNPTFFQAGTQSRSQRMSNELSTEQIQILLNYSKEAESYIPRSCLESHQFQLKCLLTHLCLAFHCAPLSSIHAQE